jgi:hypothetical protein
MRFPDERCGMAIKGAFRVWGSSSSAHGFRPAQRPCCANPVLQYNPGLHACNAIIPELT